MPSLTDAAFETIQTLQEARGFLDQDLGFVLDAEPQDRAALERLSDLCRRHGEGAKDLLILVHEHQGDDNLLKEVEELRDYFEATAELIRTRMAPLLS